MSDGERQFSYNAKGLLHCQSLRGAQQMAKKKEVQKLPSKKPAC
jgi:hypothetical protein